MSTPPFVEFPSIHRLSRDIIVTEKIDGTNAQVHITPDGQVFAGSRNRWITPDIDGFGFGEWVAEHAEELRTGLGVGSHFGEWWGSGVQRGYGLTKGEKRLSLFNVHRWTSLANQQAWAAQTDTTCIEAPCCHVVPVLWRGTFDTGEIDRTLHSLAIMGSHAAPGFMRPEGIVVFHIQSNYLFKKTLDKNDGHKAQAAATARAGRHERGVPLPGSTE